MKTMNVLAYVIMKKNMLRRHVERGYYKYGLFCSVHPILMILFSTAVILICRYDNLIFALKNSRKKIKFSELPYQTMEVLFVQLA